MEEYNLKFRTKLFYSTKEILALSMARYYINFKR